MAPERQKTISDFVNFCCQVLGIQQQPTFQLVEDTSWALERRSFGEYNPMNASLSVYSKNRNMADILRTIAHELVHHRQSELGKLKPGSGDTGSDIENQANSLAGIILREYGKMNQLIYESKLPIKKKIPLKENIENEVFSAYNGRYIFDVTKAYQYISSGKVKSIEKQYQPSMLHMFSHPEFSYSSPEKVSKLKMDYTKPIGVLVKFENPETKKTEWVLIDGNHRVRRAAEEEKPGILQVVADPEDTKKFMKINKKIPHQLFADED